jgi:ABC-2 type transport system permease protein
MNVGTLVAYRWEVRKLLAQKRTYIGIGAAALLPIVFVMVMGLQSGGPYDVPLGHNLRRTGLSITLVVLTFASRFGAQLVTALVAGDIVAAEDSEGTLKTILTRSLRRGQILGGKVLASLTYVVALLVALGISGVVSGTIAWGWRPLVTLSHARVSAAHALGLTAAALAVFAMTLVAVAAFAVFLSVATRNSAASIVGALVWALAWEAVAGLVHGSWTRYTLGKQLDAWQAVFHSPVVWSEIGRSAWVCGLYVAVPLAVAWWIFNRRDVAGA